MRTPENIIYLKEKSPVAYALHRIILDDSGRPIDYMFLDINRKFEELTGLKRDKVINKRITEVLPNIGKEDFNWVEFYGKIALEETFKEIEQYSAPLGKWFHVHAFSPEKYHFITTFVDITEKKTFQVQLENFFNLNMDLLCIIDSSGNFVKVSQSWVDFLGLTSEELLQRSILEFVHPEDMHTTIENLIQQKSQNVTSEMVNRCRRHDGSFRRIEWRSRSSMGLVYSAARDITEKTAAYKKLEESEKRYRGLIESQNDLIVRVDPENRFTYVNEAYCKLFGKRCNQLIGNKFTPLVHEDDLPDTLAAMQKLKKPPYRAQMVQRAMTKKGWRWLHWEDNAILDKNGNITEIQGVGRDISDQKQVESELRRTKEHLRIILDETPAVIYSFKLVNNVPKLTYINDNLKNILGFMPNDFIDDMDFWASCVHPDDLEGLKKKISADSDPIMVNEYRFKDKDGNYRWLLDTQKIYRKRENEIEFIGTWWDISEKKKTELALNESRTRLQHAQEFTNMGVWEYHFDTGKLIWSRECEKVFELEPGEFEGTYEAFISRVHPDDREMVRQINDPITSQNQDVHLDYEHRIITKAGKTRWVRESAGTVINKDGSPQKSIGFVMDITRLKAAETAVENEEKIRQILDNIDETMLLWSGDMRTIHYGDAEFKSLFGVDSDALVNDPDRFYKKIHNEDREAVRNFYTDIRGSENLKVEYRFMGNGKKVKWYESKKFPISNPLGDIVRFAVTVNDITDRKNFELALKKAKQKAEELNRLKSGFLSTITHELRTPLTSIIGFSDLIQTSESVEMSRQHAGIIRRSASEFLGIIEDMLAISLFKDTPVRLRKKSIRVGDLFRQNEVILTDLLSNSEKRDAISLKFTPDEEAMEKFASLDSGKVGQVLSNLFRNAIKFTEKGVIEFGFETNQNSHLVFHVKDTGIGIPKDKHELIFGDFVQVDQSISRRYGGMGVGLTIARKISEVMKGSSLTVQSESGRGAEFYFSIPVELKSEDKKILTKPANRSLKAMLTGKTVLVVDDYLPITTLLSMALKKAGATVLTASHGEEAVTVFKDSPVVDIVLMDINMPVMDGFEATRIIKEITPEVPVIAVTAYSLQLDEQKIRDAGFAMLVQKPFDMKSLLQTVKELIALAE